jgi:prepilin-type N-terminal cleavage/methylation domain-containing protein
MSMASSRKGFTLIELLVVIAIIAILAAILFPVFTAAKEKARKASCASNMREIGIAIQLYVDTYNGCYPDQASVGFDYQPTVAYTSPMGEAWIKGYSHRYLDANGNPAGMGKVLFKYLKNIRVFKCPSDRPTPKGAYDPFPVPFAEASSYYYKHIACYNADRSGSPMNMSRIKYPTKVSVLYEAGWHTGRYPFIWDITHWRSSNDHAPMHLQAIFADTHVGNIDVTYNTSSAFDANWYLIFDSQGGQDPALGARDR